MNSLTVVHPYLAHSHFAPLGKCEHTHAISTQFVKWKKLNRVCSTLVTLF